MSNTTIKKDYKNDQKALLEELSRRHGRKTANEIIEAINLSVSDTKIPDYMPVKACSEMNELFRGEAQALAKELRRVSMKWAGKGTNILDMEKRKLEKEFRRIYRLWWVSMKLFHPLYRRAKAGYDGKIATSYPKPSETTNKAIAA